MDRVKNLSHECIHLTEAEVRIEIGLGQIMYIEVIQDIIKTLEVEQGMFQMIEVVTVIIQEVIKGTEEIIITKTIEEAIIGIEVIIGIGIGHMKGRVGNITILQENV